MFSIHLDRDFAVKTGNREPGSRIRNELVRSLRLFELGERFGQVLFGHGLAVPSIQIFQHRDAFALERLGDDCPRLCAAVLPALLEGVEERDVIVPVNRDGKPAERPEFFRKSIDVKLVHRPLALTKSIHVDHGVEVRCVVMMRQLRGFPDGAFSTLAIA